MRFETIISQTLMFGMASPVAEIRLVLEGFRLDFPHFFHTSIVQKLSLAPLSNPKANSDFAICNICIRGVWLGIVWIEFTFLSLLNFFLDILFPGVL